MPDSIIIFTIVRLIVLPNLLIKRLIVLPNLLIVRLIVLTKLLIVRLNSTFVNRNINKYFSLFVSITNRNNKNGRKELQIGIIKRGKGIEL
jgi:hypothetical protein